MNSTNPIMMIIRLTATVLAAFYSLIGVDRQAENVEKIVGINETNNDSTVI